jgi:hypothetical protein
MGLTLRNYSDEAVRDQIIEALRKTAEGVAVAYGMPVRPHARGYCQPDRDHSGHDQ